MELELPVSVNGGADSVDVGVRPEDLSFVAPEQGDLRGEVYVAEPMGREQVVDVRLDDQVVRVLAPGTVNVAAGEQVGLRIDARKLHLFEPETGERLN